MAVKVGAPSPLLANGLLEQLFSRIGNWFAGLVGQIADAGQDMLRVGSLGPWWGAMQTSSSARAHALGTLALCVAILAVSVLAEWLLAWLLRRSRQRLASTALARNHASQADGASSEPAVSPGLPDPVAPADHRRALRSSRLFARTPYAIADALLYLFPLLAFMAGSGVLTSALLDPASRAYPILLALVNAYVAVRIGLTLVRLMISPSGQSMRLLHMSDNRAGYVWKWAFWLLVVSTFGVAGARAVSLLGAAPSFSVLLLKLVALAVHIMLIVVIVQTRHAVASELRGPAMERRTAWTMTRRLAADAWAFTAIFFVAGLWIVWALGLSDGFARILHFFAVTAGVIIGARVVSIILLGLTDHFFRRFADNEGAVLSGASARYRRLVRHTLVILLAILAVFILLEAWGLPVMDQFAQGTVGRHMASALWTIFVSAVVAILVWEISGFLLQRRLRLWTERGDMARVARLRTLMPMMRSVLLIAIGLIVVFTALSELGVNTAPLLAGASIIGVALGFGSQKLVQDFITGIFLLMENAMQVGDSVTLAGVSGTVEYLSIRTVRLRAGDGSLFLVPFSSVTTVNNTNRGLGNAQVQIGVTSDADIDRVFAELARIGSEMRQDPILGPLILADIDIWGVDKIDGAHAAIAGQIRTLDTGRWKVQRAFNRRVLKRFRELGIELSNPREMLLRDVPAPREAEPGLLPGPEASPP